MYKQNGSNKQTANQKIQSKTENLEREHSFAMPLFEFYMFMKQSLYVLCLFFAVVYEYAFTTVSGYKRE